MCRPMELGSSLAHGASLSGTHVSQVAAAEIKKMKEAPRSPLHSPEVESFRTVGSQLTRDSPAAPRTPDKVEGTWIVLEHCHEYP